MPLSQTLDISPAGWQSWADKPSSSSSSTAPSAYSGALCSHEPQSSAGSTGLGAVIGTAVYCFLGGVALTAAAAALLWRSRQRRSVAAAAGTSLSHVHGRSDAVEPFARALARKSLSVNAPSQPLPHPPAAHWAQPRQSILGDWPSSPTAAERFSSANDQAIQRQRLPSSTSRREVKNPLTARE